VLREVADAQPVLEREGGRSRVQANRRASNRDTQLPVAKGVAQADSPGEDADAAV